MATHHETYFSRSLNELLQRRFDGNKAALAKASGIDRAVISVLAKPSIAPSTQRLEALGDCLPKKERLRLFLATAKDVMPKKYQSEVTKTASWDEASELPEDLAVVLGHLREQALLDAETAEFLRTVGRWMGVLSKGDTNFIDPDQDVALTVAEDVVDDSVTA